MRNITILCRAKTCKYNMEFKNKGEAYRFQCGNDEIEIDMDVDVNVDVDVDVDWIKRPQCYSYIEIEDE